MTAKTFIKTIVLEGIHKQNFRPQNNSVIQLMDKKNVKPELKGNFGNTYVFIKSTSIPVSGLTSNRAQLWLLATTL